MFFCFEIYNSSLVLMIGRMEELFIEIGQIGGVSLDGDYGFGFGMLNFKYLQGIQVKIFRGVWSFQVWSLWGRIDLERFAGGS